MTDEFDIPVDYKDQEHVFKARLLNFGYTYKIQVEVNGIDVLLEPDEERNYRAVIAPEFLEGKHKIDADLLQAIVTTIESATK
jgi:hypothetical protein